MKPRILSVARLSYPLAMAIAALLAVPSADAATRIKQDNTDPLNLASSWDTLPGVADIAQWDSTVTTANSTVLGADLSWAGIKIVAPGTVPGTEPVTIGSGNTLTIGTSGIDLSTATQNLTLSCGLTLQGAQNWRSAAGITLDVAGTFTRSGAVVDFTNFNATAILGTLVNDASGILGPWATTGSTTALQYVTSTAGAISAYTGATADAGNLASLVSPTTNYSYGAAATLAGSQTGNTLRYTGGATTTALGTNGLTLNGLMNAGTNKLTISGTVASPGLVIGSSGVLNITSNGQAMDITSNISGTGVVVYSGGGGTFTLGLGNLTNSFNSYSGSTVINSGTFTNAATGSASTPYFGTGPVTFNSGTTLACNRTQLSNAITFNSTTVTAGNSFTSTLSGPITLIGTTTVSVTGNLTFSNNIGGTGGLTKTGAAFVPLNGAVNDYTGPTTIGVNGGGLTFKSSIYGNDTLKWIPANITVNSGGALVMNVGGSGEFSIAQAGTMFSQLGGVVNNNGLRAGSTFGIDTRTSGGSFVISDNLIDSSGTGGGSINFRIVGNSTTGGSTVELTGNNTYSGVTILDRAGTVKVSSINSVNGGSPPLATSSLGRPTTIANGTIQLGSNVSFIGGNLTYTGTGETTDRVVNFGGANGSVYTFSQSGPGPDPMAPTTGLLKFTSNITMTDVRGPQTVVLQGSTSGTGEMAGVLPAGDTINPNVLTKTGTGTWTLSGANLYAGLTTINNGTLKVANAKALGFGGPQRSTTAGTTVSATGSLDLNGTTGINEPITLSGTSTSALVNSNTSTAAGISNGIAGISVPLTGIGSGYTNSGFPTIIISGTGTGATATANLRGVTAASFTLSPGDKFYTVAPTVTIGGGGGASATATAVLSGGATGTLTGITITNAGNGFTSAPTIAFGTGTFSSGTVSASGTGNATNFCITGVTVTNAGSGYTSAPTYTFAGIAQTVTTALSSVILSANSSIGGAGDMTIDGVISQSGGTRTLTKVGDGKLTLNGANTYAGATSISGGTLSVAAIADSGTSNIGLSGTLSFANGTTLQYTGTGLSTTARSVDATLGGTINVSSSTGSLNLSGAVTGAFTQTLTKSGDGTLILSGTTDNGSLILNAQAGLVQLGKATSGSPHAVAGISDIATGATVQIAGTGGDQIFNGPFQPPFGLVNMSGGTLDLNGLSDGFDRLTGTGTVKNTLASTTSTLSLGTANGSGSFDGTLIDGTGTLALSKIGTGTLTLTGLNTYTGNTSVATGGTLALADNAQLKFVLGATSGTNNSITGAGTVTLDGDFVIDTTSADALPSGSWTLENVTSLTGAYGSFFTVVGFVDAGSDKWTKVNGAKLYTFDETTGILTLASASAYDSWATANGLTGLPASSTDPAKDADPDGDGKNNLYEFAFDGNPLTGVNDGKIVGKTATLLSLDTVMTLTLPVRGTATPTITPTFSDSSGDQLSTLIDGIYYRIEGDVNLSSFADAISEVTGTDATTIQSTMPALSGAGWTYRTFRAPGTVPTAPKVFLRAKISETP